MAREFRGGLGERLESLLYDERKLLAYLLRTLRALRTWRCCARRRRRDPGPAIPRTCRRLVRRLLGPDARAIADCRMRSWPLLASPRDRLGLRDFGPGRRRAAYR